MTDFLTRLAERSLRLAPVLEPLQPPMFAPESALLAGVPQETTAEEGARASAEPGPSPRLRPVLAVSKGDEAGVLEQARTRVSSPPSLVAPSTTLPGETPPRAFDMQPGVPGRELPRGAEELPAAFAPVLSPRTSQPSSAPVQEEARQPVTTAVMTPLAQPHETDQAHGHDQSGSHVFPIPVTHADTPTPAQRPTPGTPDTPSRVIDRRVAFEMVPMPGVEMVPVPGAVPVAFPADQRRAAPEPSPTAPTIRVSIGRIEVRAIMPSVPPARHTPPAQSRPQLSLEDYLQQHRGGSR
jgi:hypothetical protein